MEEVIEDIVKYVQKKTCDFSYMDQYYMLTELSERMNDIGREALQIEYMIEEEKGGEE